MKTLKLLRKSPITMKRLTATALLLTSSLFISIANANALFTLENLERDRAALLQNLSAGQLTVHQRAQKNNNIVRRLTDIERMVLRDDRIAASNSVMAKKAFENYDLTFLVHAGSESKKSPMVHWLSELNITTSNIKASHIGVR